MDAYLMEYPRTRDNSLYVLFYGANDYLTCQDEPGKNLAIDVVDSICSNAEKLADNFINSSAGTSSGIVHIALVNMPDITKTPRYNESDFIHRRSMISGLVNQHNQGLENCRQKLTEQKSYAGRVNFMVIDLHSKLNEALASLPDNYHKDEACYTGHQFRKREATDYISLNSLDDLINSFPGKTCQDPDTHAFWDGDHPTRMLHARITKSICEEMKSQFVMDCSRIPETQTAGNYPKTAFNP